MTLLFDKFSGYNNEMFCYEFIADHSAYNKGKMTQDEVFEALKMVYKTEQATGTWANLMPSKHKITMLTTNLAKANVELHKMKSLDVVAVGVMVVVVVGVAVPEGATTIVELKRAVAVATMQPHPMHGCSQGPPTPSSIPPKAMR
jgi:hypothetical protein